MYCYLSKVSVIAKAHLSLLFIVKRRTLVSSLIILSFTPFKYKLGLIKTLIDRAYKINNTTQGFHNDIKNLSEILKRNMFPKWLIDKSVKGYLSKVTTTGKDASKCEISNFFSSGLRPGSKAFPGKNNLLVIFSKV